MSAASMMRVFAALCTIAAHSLSSATELDALDAASALADDECNAGPSDTACSLNALQVKANKLAATAEQGTSPDATEGSATLKEELTKAEDQEDGDTAESATDLEAYDDPSKGAFLTQEEMGVHAAILGASTCGCCCHHEEKISGIWDTCASKANGCCRSCGIWHAQHSPGKHGGGSYGAVYVGEKVVPRTPVGGMEGITASTAGSLSYVFQAAARKAGYSSHWALITNPWRSRTQHQLHVIVKPLDGRGASLASSLEKVTQCRTGSWQNAHFACIYSKAQLFHSMPSVFSQVYSLAAGGAMGRLETNPHGQPTLATVGIAVLFICGGKPVVLATGDGHGHCSIEHSITR